MEARYRADRYIYSSMDTEDLRDSYLVQDLFQPGRATLNYFEVDRAIVGGVVPLAEPVPLEAPDGLSAETFCQHREVGLLNIGGAGEITVDGLRCELERLDCLYVGRGAREVVLASADTDTPARFYLVSYPSQVDRAPVLVTRTQATQVDLGTAEKSNQRTILKYIHPETVDSGQIVMGVTSLQEGSVWNTMPPHTHGRRTEIYMYFDLGDDLVFHFMGVPEATRHMVVREGEAVVSPQWSLHSGVGTRSYSFCWCMGGENQDFDDMDAIDLAKLR